MAHILAQLLILAALPTASVLPVPQGAFPADVGGWRLVVGPEALDKVTIYDYMDGEADIYMTYAFRCMHHAEYERDGRALVVEAYDLGSPAEAFGMFTNITTGKPVRLAQAGRYGYGELCFWQGRYFTKIYEKKRAQDVRPAIAGLASHILPALGDAGPPSPFIRAMLPAALKPTNIRYFHRDVNLNNFYYVSTENILALSDETTCVLADCSFAEGAPAILSAAQRSGESPPVRDPSPSAQDDSETSRPVKVLVIRYPSESVRGKAWADFCRAIFPGEATTAGDAFRSERVPEGTYTGIKKMSTPSGAPLLGICFKGTSTDECHSVLGVVEMYIRLPVSGLLWVLLGSGALSDTVLWRCTMLRG
jgi:hypothetical protein